MKLFNTKKIRHFSLIQADKQKLVSNINKIIGQLETIRSDIDSDNTCDESIIQILAVKGSVESIGRTLVGKGILECIDEYSKDELDQIIKNIFKIS